MIVLKIRMAPYAAAVVRRVLMAAAAQARLPVDRASEAELLAEVITLAAFEETPGEWMTFQFDTQPGRIKVLAGPMPSSAADLAGWSSSSAPKIATVANEIWSESINGDEFLCFEVGADAPARLTGR